jgi:hypothetical protein
MTNFKVGDKVQIDPALVNGGVRKTRGVGTILNTSDGGTRCCVSWPDNTTSYILTRDLVPVGGRG